MGTASSHSRDRPGHTIKKPTIGIVGLIGDVGVARFELTASCSQSRRDTGLRYTPKSRQIYTEKRLDGLREGSVVNSPKTRTLKRTRNLAGTRGACHMVQTFHRTKGRIPPFDIHQVGIAPGFQQGDQNEGTVTPSAMHQGLLGGLHRRLGG